LVWRLKDRARAGQQVPNGLGENTEPLAKLPAFIRPSSSASTTGAAGRIT